MLGGGGHAKVVLDAIRASDCCQVVGILDDDGAKSGQQVLGVPILGLCSELSKLSGKLKLKGFVVAIGNNYIREWKFRKACQTGLKPFTVIHPTAHLSADAKVGAGVVILAGVVVNPGTVIEDNVCINTSASVDHDNRLGNHCHVFPNATLTGGVQVGEYSYIGSGAVINPYLRIGCYSYVGAGAVVLRDVPDGVTVAGVPARKIADQPNRPEK